VVALPVEAIDDFEWKNTYIYSARMCTSKGVRPISACIDKFKALGCYKSSWGYLLKVCVNHNTKVDAIDLYDVIKHFEDNSKCIIDSIAIDYDDTLKDGEAKVFQLHYYCDDGWSFLDDFHQKILPSGSVEEIKKELESMSTVEKRREIRYAFNWIEYTETRSWDDTKVVLEYLKSIGSDGFTSLIFNNLNIFPISIGEITPNHWRFIKEIVLWAISNGGQLNDIFWNETLFEHYLGKIEQAKNLNCKKNSDFYESIQNGDALAELLWEMGGDKCRRT
jgi:hypothetical protein